MSYQKNEHSPLLPNFKNGMAMEVNTYGESYSQESEDEGSLLLFSHHTEEPAYTTLCQRRYLTRFASALLIFLAGICTHSFFETLPLDQVISQVETLANDDDASSNSTHTKTKMPPKRPYQLVERHVGDSFFDHYNFFNGPDSIGSAGHQMYVSREEAQKLGLFNVTTDEEHGQPVVYMKSAPAPANSSQKEMGNSDN
eukprot:CAMPEP_0172447252 /NCGR_PEP_ID=MMETSP1065-20121228/6595_1 /TAXON_ID=265537 /ORGANISM="Amphiprora paludosa, Strain CCMP125" /LENGTH=197 /DNA_ID=CAMNT_0013198499 /DNA_START=119 /DNA_END=709 /DNA_ORIENTATION=+